MKGIDNFIIVVGNNNIETIHYELNSGKKISHQVPVRQIVIDYIKHHINKIKYYINCINNGIDEADNDIIAIIAALPSTPPNNINSIHLIIEGYNRLHNTDITYEEVVE